MLSHCADKHLTYAAFSLHLALQQTLQHTLQHTIQRTPQHTTIHGNTHCNIRRMLPSHCNTHCNRLCNVHRNVHCNTLQYIETQTATFNACCITFQLALALPSSFVVLFLFPRFASGKRSSAVCLQVFDRCCLLTATCTATDSATYTATYTATH